MKNLLPFLLFVFFFNTINANSYQRDVWKFLDKSYKSLLTNPKQAVDYTLQAFDILKQTTDSNLIVSTLIVSGHAYMLYGNFDMSVNTYYKALSYCPAKDLKTKAKINVNLGTLYGSLKDFSKAISLIDNATSTYKALKDSSGIANAYNARGLIHVYMKEYEIADKFFKDALRINKTLGDKKNMAANINNLCLYEGDSEEKIKLIQEAIVINKNLNALWSLAENYNNLGMQLFYAKKNDEALSALKKAAVYAFEVNAHELICDNYEYLSKVYATQKCYKEAYNSLLNFEKKREQLLQKRELVNIERNLIKQKLQNQKKESEIQKHMHQIELLKRNISLAVVLFLCITLLAFFLIKQYKRKKDLQISKGQTELLLKDKIITELKLQQQAVELNIKSEKLESTQSELTNFVLFLNSRNELLEKIREMIKSAYKMNSNEILIHLKKINTYILQFKKLEDDNNSLTREVDEQNHEFLSRLEQKHPGLTHGEKKLATFLRINLSTKEISLLTGISVKAISMARYRLRKTLCLHSQDDISAYLRDI
ncbi:tetratricopeptide repeat protein [Bacteroides sp.]|uniref:tetratricopeptide repeat protein n=1 Tax=Bacteroides sp. TaxID=29523 RepID=UPI0025C2772D|nr:tetratricopeptide repeat protein [Bacteroides sp.]